MDISIFLAQAFGLYLLIGGIALLMNQELTNALIKKFSSHADDVAMGGFLALIIGIPLVLIHNVWDGSWRVLVTILVWLTFLKGVVRVLAPRAVTVWSQSLAKQPGLLRMLLLSMVILGVILAAFGFGFEIT